MPNPNDSPIAPEPLEGINVDYAEYLLFGVPLPDGTKPDEQQVGLWLETLTPGQREGVLRDKAAVDDRRAREEQALQSITKTAPELLVGNLPEEQKNRLEALFGTDIQFAIGINQSEAAQTTDDATEVLTKHGGIEMMDYGTSFARRFRLYDSGVAEDHPGIAESYLLGHYGPEIGRFVAVFPTAQTEQGPTSLINEYDDQVLPEDFLREMPFREDSWQFVVDSRYVAGFIDDSGYHANSSFLTDQPPRFD